MSDPANKTEFPPRPILPEPHLHNITGDESGVIQQQRSWKYREYRMSFIRIPSYASPPIQLVIIAFVCFLCPGMLNALTGIGGSGQINHRVADDANTALYSTFAIFGFFAGTFINVLGIKIAVVIGAFGYSVYMAAFLCYSSTGNSGFTIFAGALLGFCAALLWTAEGTILMSYPPEQSKGKYISGLWMIFNFGAVIGSLIPLAQNIHVHESKTVTNGTYIGFLVLTTLGTLLACALVNAKDVVRQDGSHITLAPNPSWKTEFFWFYQTLRTEPWILCLFPMFFASTWSYTYVFNDVNAVRFNTRTRALNNTLYYMMEMVGALLFGYALDRLWVRRATRAKILWSVVMSLNMAVWTSSYVFQKDHTRAGVSAIAFSILDWKDSGYTGPMFLYMFYGFCDAAWQTSVYWTIGSLTNDGRKLAIFAGFYKGIQSAGAAIVWRLDSIQTPYMTILVSCWALYCGSLLVALPVILFKIPDHIDGVLPDAEP